MVTPGGLGGDYEAPAGFVASALDNLAVFGAYRFRLAMLVVNVLVIVPMLDPWSPIWSVLVGTSVVAVLFVLYRIEPPNADGRPAPRPM